MWCTHAVSVKGPLQHEMAGFSPSGTKTRDSGVYKGMLWCLIIRRTGTCQRHLFFWPTASCEHSWESQGWGACKRDLLQLCNALNDRHWSGWWWIERNTAASPSSHHMYNKNWRGRCQISLLFFQNCCQRHFFFSFSLLGSVMQLPLCTCKSTDTSD